MRRLQTKSLSTDRSSQLWPLGEPLWPCGGLHSAQHSEPWSGLNLVFPALRPAAALSPRPQGSGHHCARCSPHCPPHTWTGQAASPRSHSPLCPGASSLPVETLLIFFLIKKVSRALDEMFEEHVRPSPAPDPQSFPEATVAVRWDHADPSLAVSTSASLGERLFLYR